MSQVSQRIEDGVSGRVYREFQGVKYWLWPKRGLYVSQKGGKQNMLHRDWYCAVVGGILESGFEVVPVANDWECFVLSNWVRRERNSCRKQEVKHEPQEFLGIKYYKKPQGYYKSEFVKYGGKLLHRVVWEHFNGQIPSGFHIHHINGNKADNSIENLEAISASDHSTHHGATNPWVGSAANKSQLIKAGELAKQWHASAEGIEWHRSNGVKSLEKRQKFIKKCIQCGSEYETIWVNKSKFCGKRCKVDSYKSKSTSLRSDN